MDEQGKTYFCTLFLNQVVMDWTILNTIVTIVSIVVGVVGISAVVYYLFPKIWRKKYIKEHNPTPHFEQEMKYGDIRNTCHRILCMPERLQSWCFSEGCLYGNRYHSAIHGSSSLSLQHLCKDRLFL